MNSSKRGESQKQVEPGSIHGEKRLQELSACEVSDEVSLLERPVQVLGRDDDGRGVGGWRHGVLLWNVLIHE